MEIVQEALKEYGAKLHGTGYIERHDGKVTMVRPVIMRQRLRFETPDGRLLATGPIKADFVHEFVKRYWLWSKKPCAIK